MSRETDSDSTETETAEATRAAEARANFMLSECKSELVMDWKNEGGGASYIVFSFGLSSFLFRSRSRRNALSQPSIPDTPV